VAVKKGGGGDEADLIFGLIWCGLLHNMVGAIFSGAKLHN
jgi:hypothetical protein